MSYKKTRKENMKKITFNTLKKYARQGRLHHHVEGEYSGMVDGMEFRKNSLLDVIATKTTLEDLEKFKVTKNWITEKHHGVIELSNCCYVVKFLVSKEV
tara:strand:- start:14039 stop:14335 length:297 start_codon:yes stop_codon:yes gene_type:complete